MATKLYDAVHFRSVGQNPDGSAKSISTIVGAVIKCDSGSIMLKMNYHPNDNEPLYLFAPKPKEQPPVGNNDDAPF